MTLITSCMVDYISISVLINPQFSNDKIMNCGSHFSPGIMVFLKEKKIVRISVRRVCEVKLEIICFPLLNYLFLIFTYCKFRIHLLELVKTKWAVPKGITCKYFPRNLEAIVNSCQHFHNFPSQYCASMGGWWETYSAINIRSFFLTQFISWRIETVFTCSDMAFHPKSSVLSHSYVSPRRGLNGFPVRLAVLA